MAAAAAMRRAPNPNEFRYISSDGRTDGRTHEGEGGTSANLVVGGNLGMRRSEWRSDGRTDEAVTEALLKAVNDF